MRRDSLYDDLLVAAIKLASTRMSLAVPSLRAVARACDVSATAVNSGCAPGLTAQDLWACVHGVLSLRIHKPDHPWPEQPAAQLDRLLIST